MSPSRDDDPLTAIICFRQRSYNQLQVRDDGVTKVTSSINSVTGRGPEGTADGVAIYNPSPDWGASGQEGRRTAVSGGCYRGSERGPKGGRKGGVLGGSGGVPRGGPKPQNPGFRDPEKPPRDPWENGRVISGLQPLSRLGELLNTLRNVHPRPGGSRGTPWGPFSHPRPGGPKRSPFGPSMDIAILRCFANLTASYRLRRQWVGLDDKR